MQLGQNCINMVCMCIGGQVLDESPVTFLPLPVIKPSWDDLLQVDTAETMKKQFDGRTVLYTTSTVLDKLKFNRC